MIRLQIILTMDDDYPISELQPWLESDGLMVESIRTLPVRTVIIRHGARSDYEDWLARHPGQTEADYQRAIEDADTPEG